MVINHLLSGMILQVPPFRGTRNNQVKVKDKLNDKSSQRHSDFSEIMDAAKGAIGKAEGTVDGVG